MGIAKDKDRWYSDVTQDSATLAWVRRLKFRGVWYRDPRSYGTRHDAALAPIFLCGPLAPIKEAA